MPMLLVGDNDREFELTVIRERLADVQDGMGDDMAVTIAFRVVTGDAEWEETAPSINLFELSSLADWLESVAAGGAAGSVHDLAEVDILEPELNFQVTKDFGDSVNIRVRFHLEGTPDELVLGAETDEARHVDLRVSREALRVAAAQWKEDVREALGDEPKDDLFGDADAGMVREPGINLGPGITGEGEFDATGEGVEELGDDEVRLKV